AACSSARGAVRGSPQGAQARTYHLVVINRRQLLDAFVLVLQRSGGWRQVNKASKRNAISYRIRLPIIAHVIVFAIVVATERVCFIVRDVAALQPENKKSITISLKKTKVYRFRFFLLHGDFLNFRVHTCSD